MSSHYGFSYYNDESANTVDYACFNIDHCDKGVCCDGEHMYSHENVRLRRGHTHFSESVDKSKVWWA